MSLVPWRKQAPTAFQSEINRLFDDFFGAPLTTPFTGGTWAPAVSISDGPEAYTVRAELPGMEPGDVDIDISHNVVTLRGERKEEKRDEKERMLRHEFTYGAFMRQFSLPNEVDPERAEAKMDKGVLTLKLPKSNATRARTIKPK